MPFRGSFRGCALVTISLFFNSTCSTQNATHKFPTLETYVHTLMLVYISKQFGPLMADRLPNDPFGSSKVLVPPLPSNFLHPPRNPAATGRPTFLDITRELSLPDTKLLKWLKEEEEEEEEDNSKAAILGADLLCGEGLYKDLQVKHKQSTDDDYDLVMSL